MRSSYPEQPGSRGIDTSIAAAASIRPGLQRKVGDAIRAAGIAGRTSDELADELAIDRGSVQPRTSELKAKGLIVDSGRRRKNAAGKACVVWTWAVQS